MHKVVADTLLPTAEKVLGRMDAKCISLTFAIVSSCFQRRWLALNLIKSLKVLKKPMQSKESNEYLNEVGWIL